MKIIASWSNSISNIPKKDWNALKSKNALSSWGWLRTIEETASQNWRLLYLLLHDDNNQLIGAAICQTINQSTDDRMDALIFGRLQRLARHSHLSMAPALACGSCGTYGVHLLTYSAISSNKQYIIENYLLDSIESKARELKLPLAFVHVLESQQNLIEKLKKRKFIGTSIPPMTQLDVTWKEFSGYELHTKNISLNSFKMIRKERNRNKHEGVVIEVLNDVEQHQERLIELLNMTTLKYSGVPFWYKDNFFSKLKENLANEAVIFAAWKQNKLVGVCVLLCSTDEGFLTEIGVDHEFCGNDFTYFNIAYYTPIEWAINNNLRKLHLDNALQELKLRRGFYLVNDYFYYKPNSLICRYTVRWLFNLHTRWFQYKHAHLKRWHSLGQKT